MDAVLPIVIVGAGMAGLSCAHHLHAAGVAVQVLDKSRGPSGRMSTRRGDGWQCDHGAGYFTALHPDFQAQVQRWEEAGVAGVWQPRIGHVNGDVGSSAVVTQPQRWVGVPRMTAPAGWMARGLSMTLQATVKQLARDGDAWTVTTAEHGTLPERFGRVVVAVPSVQAQPLLQPVAPDFAALAASAAMCGSWVLMMQFDQKLDLPWDAADITNSPVAWLARDSSKPGRAGSESWVLHASASWTQEHMEDTPEQATAALLQAFAELTGGAYQPVSLSAHRWRYAQSAPGLDLGCAWDAQMQLGVCGDWLHGGQVEGAWLSGQALAQKIIAQR